MANVTLGPFPLRVSTLVALGLLLAAGFIAVTYLRVLLIIAPLLFLA